MALRKQIIAFQGFHGAYSHQASHYFLPDAEILPLVTFEETFAAVKNGAASHACIPIENSIAGRVADVHHLLPNSGLHICAEYFHPIIHHLLALPQASLEDIKYVHSHIHALAQCRKFLKQHNIQPIIHADTAGAARDIAQRNDPEHAVIASELAGKIYGLHSLSESVADYMHNTTRFLLMSPEPHETGITEKTITTLLFRTKNVPAALYKALGGFATNGLNLTKLESYLIEGSFIAAQFYADIEGHPDSDAFQYAFDELSHFTSSLDIIGVYPADQSRYVSCC